MLNVIKLQEQKQNLIGNGFYDTWLPFSRINDYISAYEQVSGNYVHAIHEWVAGMKSEPIWINKYEPFNSINTPQHQIYGVYKDGNFFFIEQWYLSTAAAVASNKSIDEISGMEPEQYVELLRQFGYLVDTLAHWCGKDKLKNGYIWNSIKFLSLWDVALYIDGYSKINNTSLIKRLIKDVNKKVYGYYLYKSYIDKPIIRNFAGINTLIPQNKKLL